MIEDFKQKFLEFCKSKPADEYYVCTNPRNCALGQFVSHHKGHGNADGYTHNDVYTPYSEDVYYASIGISDTYGSDINNTDEDFFTFGKLVKRLEA